MRTVSISLLVTAVLAAVLAAAACDVGNGTTESVRIAVSRTPLSMPIYVADELGLFRDEGLDVTLTEVAGGKRSFERMMSGDADFATSSDSVIVFKAFRRDDFVNLATFVQSDNDVKVLAAEHSGVRQASDLVGQRVAVLKGTASEYFLSVWLGLSGVHTDQVQMVNARPQDMPGVLKRGQVSAVAIWEPYVFETLQALDGKARIFETKGLYGLTFNLIARKSYVRDHSEASERLLRALDVAIGRISEDPAMAQRIMRQRLGLDEDFIQWVWGDYLFKLSLGRSLLLTLENQGRWAMQSGQVTGESLPDFSQLIDTGPLSAVKPSAVTVYR